MKTLTRLVAGIAIPAFILAWGIAGAWAQVGPAAALAKVTVSSEVA